MDNHTDIPVLASYLMTPRCYQSVIVDFNFADVACLQLILSKILGYSIILVTSTFMKLPQIMKILHARTGQGVSVVSQTLMLVASSLAVGYAMARNYHVSLWGESIALALQTFIVCILILWYDGKVLPTIMFSVIYLIFMIILMSPAVPLEVHIFMQFFGIFIGAFSKVIQAWVNFQNQGTGQLSFISTSMMNFRSFGRLYTGITQTGDIYNITEFGIHCFLNVLLTGQIIYYRRLNSQKRKQKTN